METWFWSQEYDFEARISDSECFAVLANFLLVGWYAGGTMIRSMPAVLALLVISLLAPPALQAQLGGMGGHRPAYQIHVQLRYPNGQPGPRGIHVRLESAEGGAEADCETAAGGICEFRPQYAGVYTVRMSEPNYKEATARVDLVGTPTGYVTFELKPLAKEHTDEISPNVPTPGAARVSAADLGVPEDARKEYEKGEAALHAKDAGKAAKYFEKAAKLYENYPQAYRMMGEAYLQEQDYKKCEEALKKSIALDPKLADAYVDLGAVYNQQKNYPQAEIELKKGLELSPEATSAKYELAKTYLATNRWQDAAPYARDVVNETPTLAGAHVLYGNILLKQRDGNGALREYKEYLELEPGGTMATQVREQVEKLEKALSK
jgi:Flp pilus assembly protein TadD